MTAFLARLIDRSRGTAEVIRPRPASRFEPVEPGHRTLLPPAAPDTGESRLVSAEEVTATPTGESIRDHGSERSPNAPAPVRSRSEQSNEMQPGRPWTSAPIDRGASESVGKQPSPSSERSSLAPDTPRERSEAKAARASTTPASARKVAPSRADLTTPQSVVAPVDATRERVRTETRVVREQHLLEPVVRETVVERVLPAGDERDGQNDGADHRGRVDRRSGSPPSDATPAEGRSIRPQVRPAPSGEPPAPRSGRQVESAPTIHVTIGRIEVRATPPTASPKKERTQPVVMTLEEYLRVRRNGGDR